MSARFSSLPFKKNPDSFTFFPCGRCCESPPEVAAILQLQALAASARAQAGSHCDTPPAGHPRTATPRRQKAQHQRQAWCQRHKQVHARLILDKENRYDLCRLFLLKLLVANLRFSEGFRRASAITAAASANASSKKLLPRASAVQFFDLFPISLLRTQRELPRSMWDRIC